MKRFFTAAAVALLVASPALAGNGGNLNPSGVFGTFSATGIVSTLPTNSNGFSAGVTNEGFTGVTRGNGGFQAVSGNQTTTFGNGWTNAQGGLAGFGGSGSFGAFGRR